MKTSILCKTLPKIIFHTCFILSVLFFTNDSAFSKSRIKDDKTPLHIVSDKMVAKRASSMVEFMGNVKATRGGSIILADSMKIYFTNDNTDAKNKDKPDQNDVEKIISTGNVRYTEGEQKAFADKAVYTTKDEVLILTGKSVKLITGSSYVTGKKITLFRKQDIMEVESDNTKRVEAFFNPKDNGTDKQ